MKNTDGAYIEDLVRRAQDRDSDAFAELYILTYPRQLAIARKYLRDDDAAQDAIQEVYILALRNIGGLRDPRFFNTWVSQINYRVCYDMSLRLKKLHIMEDTEFDKIADGNVYSNPEDILMRNAGSEELRRALSMLPMREQNAIVLKFMAEMSLEEIAETMECSVSSVTRYLNHGYGRLKRLLKEEGA